MTPHKFTDLREKLAALKAARASTPAPTLSNPAPPPTTSQGTDRHGNTITYNTRQQEAIDLILSGQSCVVIGAAGTGKTTIQKASSTGLIQSGRVLPALDADHKYLKAKAPAIAIVAYTRRATNNIRRNLDPSLQSCCITIHKLLEYTLVEDYIVDPETGQEKRTMRFEPARTAIDPLPPSIRTIIIEEASMVSTHLFKEIQDACPHNPQFIFLGDIQQLPPVFGSAILGYKMLELPVVELTEVHRQALDSPILKLAHRVLSGVPIPSKEFHTLNAPNKLKIHPWAKTVSADIATITLAKFFARQLETHKYNPETDAILIPFNKSCGTDELNKHIATKIAHMNHKEVYEIIHGFKKSYYSVGDKCLYEREDAIIESIDHNPQYTRRTPQPASTTMDYWGQGSNIQQEEEDFDIDLILEHVTPSDDDETNTHAASHVITLRLLDSERTVKIRSAGDVDALILGYAITIHKAQGSEWDKVYLCLHKSHNMMIQRELLYTAVTRAKQELFCICEPDTFEKGITRQRIKGDTWQEKAEYFKGKLNEGVMQS